MPIPPDGHALPNGMVRQIRSVPGKRWPQKKVIGWIPVNKPYYKEEDFVTADGVRLMVPNDNYRREYKDEYRKYADSIGLKTDERNPPESISVGLYLLILGIVSKLGVYELLCKVFSVGFANAVIDLAIYFIMCSDNANNKMKYNLNKELTFSLEPLSKSWYSKTFQNYVIDYKPEVMFGDHSVREFMIEWVSLRKSGLMDSYLSLDGSNFDCQSVVNIEAEPGHAKTHKKINIVGVMVAVEASGDGKGMPLAYVIDPGSRPDLITAQELLSFFTGMGLDIKGLIADRGFPYEDVLALCDELKIPYLMMAKSNSNAFASMFERYGKELFWNEDYWMRGTNSEYGISDFPIKYYSEKNRNQDRDVCAGLFFRGSKASINRVNDKKDLNVELRRVDRLLTDFNKSGKIEEALQKANETQDSDNQNNGELEEETKTMSDEEKILAALQASKIFVISEFENVIDIKIDSDVAKAYTDINHDTLSKKYEDMGYACMISPVPMTAQEMTDVYRLRDVSEKVFCSMKTELGFTTSRTSGDNAFHGKFFVCFIADIIRSEIVRVFQRYEEKKHISIDTNAMILSFSGIEYTRCGSGYVYSGQTTLPQREILEELGIEYAALKELGPLVSARISKKDFDKLRDEKRVIPTVPEPRGPGRPEGSKNKQKKESKQKVSGCKNNKKAKNSKTTKENSEAKSKIEKNTAKSETNSKLSGDNTTGLQKKRGRPAGSKNKKTIEREMAAAAERERRIAQGLPPEEPKNKGGRPKGRKNDKTLEREAADKARREAAESVQAKPPKEQTSRVGTVYKTTLRQEEYDRQLSEETGIDIIGNPPPRPWSNAFRAAENRRRAKLRKLAEEKRRELRSASDSTPDQE